jgi:hypothetical protein
MAKSSIALDERKLNAIDAMSEIPPDEEAESIVTSTPGSASRGGCMTN